MNFLFFLLLILGFVIYYELRILKVTKKCDKENYDGKTDLYVANDFMGPDHLFQNMGLLLLVFQ